MVSPLHTSRNAKDIAILQIDGRNLPTLTLGDSDRVQLGQPIHLLGFPGVVLYHGLLDKRSAVEASVTSGQVSSAKRDARGTPVIQGVNFLVPANIVRTAGRPALDSPRQSMPGIG